MTEIRNSAGKLICCLDPEKLIVEIVCKGIKTTIYIKPNGELKVVDKAA